MQKLILPINNTRLTASYKNSAYLKKFGFVHYGADFVSNAGDTKIYGSGDGLVVNTGTDSIVGKIMIIRYPQAYNNITNSYHDIVIRYYHLDSIALGVGAKVTKDTVIGYYGNTGVLVMGKHLHMEIDKDTLHPLYSPTVLHSNLLRGRLFGAVDKDMTDPLQWMHIKTSAPDSQIFSTANDSYINSNNKFIPVVI